MLEIHDNHGTRTSKVARETEIMIYRLESTLQKLTGDVIEHGWKQCQQYSDSIDFSMDFIIVGKAIISGTNLKQQSWTCS
jgi:hypothetical protein